MGASGRNAKFPGALHPWTTAKDWPYPPRDPINLLLANHTRAEAETLLRAVGMRHVGQLERLSEPQWFRHALSGEQLSAASAASDRDWLHRGERLHARLFSPGPGGSEPGLGQYTALTAHLDRISMHWRCLRSKAPEVAASFTMSREDLASRMAALPLQVRTVRTRNVGSVRQCDGTRVVADGRVVVVG